MGELISIIIVNYNGQRWLKKCLDSIYNQTYKNYEIILVDNNSTDNSIELVKNNFPKVNILCSKKNLGFSGGNNLGLKKSKGNLIMLLNNDTWVESNFLEKMKETYSKFNNAVIGPTEADYYSKESRIYSIHLDPFGHFIYLKGRNIRNNDFYLSGVCLLFSKKLYYETGGLDSDFFMYGEDWDWFWRLLLFNIKFYKNNDIFVYHYGSGSSEKGINYLHFLWRNQNALQILLKNYNWYNLFWVIPIYFLQNIVEIIFFLFILKPTISLSYIQGWYFNLKNIKKIMKKRRYIQQYRKVSDYEIMKRMYFGFAKIYHLTSFIKSE